MKNCLNCGSSVTNNFCSNCGQKVSTHRFSMKHFFVHDLIHGVFHLDKGFLFTIHALFTYPGHNIRNYVEGKRVNYFNAFTSIIIILSIMHLVENYALVDLENIYGKGQLVGFMKIMKHYTKFVIIAYIPILTLASYLVFKRSNQHFTEYLVLNSYMMSGILIIRLLNQAVFVFCGDIGVLKTLKYVFVFLEIAYCYWFYTQYFSAFLLSKKALFYRVFLFSVLYFLIRGFISFVTDMVGGGHLLN